MSAEDTNLVGIYAEGGLGYTAERLCQVLRPKILAGPRILSFIALNGFGILVKNDLTM